MDTETKNQPAAVAFETTPTALSSSALLAALTLAIVELRARRRNAISEGNTKLEEECWCEENRLEPLQRQELIRLSAANADISDGGRRNMTHRPANRKTEPRGVGGNPPFDSMRLLSCRCFDDADKEAIEHVTMLLTEYAWSDDPMTAPAQELKVAMNAIWDYWQARQDNDKVERRAPSTFAPTPGSTPNYQPIWEASLQGSTKMPPCPKCGGVMKDDSGFLVCGAKCTNPNCDFSDYECNVS
jgi:hypothetical protein